MEREKYMSKKTKDKVKRLPASGIINSEEEYKSAKERLESYIKEYNWLKSASEPAKEVAKEAQNIMPMINNGNSEAVQKYYLNYSQYLVNKKSLIESGEYEAILMQNIQTLFVQTRQYEIDTKDYSTFDIIKGLFTRNPIVIEDWKMDRLLSRARIWDGLPKEKDINALSVQPVKDIMKYISKYYEIVGLNLDIAQPETVLPAISDGYLTPTQEKLIELVNEYIKGSEFKNSIVNVTVNPETKNDSDENKEQGSRNTSKKMFVKRAKEDKGEIGK